MELNLLTVAATTATLLSTCLLSAYIMRRKRIFEGPPVTKLDVPPSKGMTSRLFGLAKQLASAFPHLTLLPSSGPEFKVSTNSYWAQQECDAKPTCIIQPRDTGKLCAIVQMIKREYDHQGKSTRQGPSIGTFAVRSGGHSPIAGAATMDGGVVIDLVFLFDISISFIFKMVFVGSGAKWGEVSRFLDGKGLATVGGRNSAVGVGGLTLGGRYLFLPFFW